ncbi:hypothetical protein FBU31_002886, partial [Coemansia sp. 'formosensis']
RCGGCGGYSGFSFGFTFVSSFTNDVDTNSNLSNLNKNALYANNVNTNATSNNVHALNNANKIA